MTNQIKYIEEVIQSHLLNDHFRTGLDKNELSNLVQILHESQEGVIFSIPEHDIYLLKDENKNWVNARICEVNHHSMRNRLINDNYISKFKFHAIFNGDDDTVFNFEVFIQNT